MDYIAHQVPLSMEFSRREYWSGLPFPSPGNLPHPVTEPTSPALAGAFCTTLPPRKSQAYTVKNLLPMWEIWVRSLGREDPLQKRMATHSSILAWRIPYTGAIVQVVAKT